jgi:uncharacterized protein YqjF (DUF2071 family)
MIQYETRLQNPGKSRKLSFYKKDIAAGDKPMVYSLDGDRFVLRQIESITNHGKHDLLFVSIGISKSLQCRNDTKLLTFDGGWMEVKDLRMGNLIMGVRTMIQRPRAHSRGAFLQMDDTIDALATWTPITEIRKSHIMWSGKRNDVMSVKMIGTDNFVTSTGLVVYGGTE